MLNPHSRRSIGKCAVDLYEAGNRREALDLLRQLANASEQYDQCGALNPLWRETVRSGAKRAGIPQPAAIKAFHNV